MKKLLTRLQEDSVGAVDTLTQSYSRKWEAMSGMENANPVIKALASHDLIFVVLGVSLIIWFILLFFIIRVDKKVSKLEMELNQKNKDGKHEA